MDRDLLRLTAGTFRRDAGDGMQLKLLSALEVLQARREGAELTAEDRERALCVNACLLARALLRRGKPVCASGREVLDRFTVSQIQRLSRLWAQFDREENPSVTSDTERLEQLKKAWSTRLRSALNGVCSACSGRSRPSSGSGT